MVDSELRSDLLYMINDRQQITYSELADIMFSRGVSEANLKSELDKLKNDNLIAARSSGGIMTYYVLQQEPQLRKILIVEDDRNINKLMALSIGKGFDITQIYDGKEAIKHINENVPDLVILDLMLPGVDGLTICQHIKGSSNMKKTIVIIISAMEATSSRFKGIKYGADYYIKKPFDPDELRSLVTIFLKKKGKRLDPLVDLPNEDKISEEVEKSVTSGNTYEIGRLTIEGIGSFARKYGQEQTFTILRLISQLLQDSVKDENGSGFVGFLGNEDFVVAGESSAVSHMVNKVVDEFDAVQNFVYQGENNTMEFGMKSYEGEKQMLKLSYKKTSKEDLIQKHAEIMKRRQQNSIGAFTYEELRNMLGSNNLDIIIKRGANGVTLGIGKSAEDSSENRKPELI